MDITPSLDKLPENLPEITSAVVEEALGILQKTVPLLKLESAPKELDKALVAGDIAVGTRPNKVFQATFILPPADTADREALIRGLEEHTSGDIRSVVDKLDPTENFLRLQLFVKLTWADDEAEREANGYALISEIEGPNSIPICLYPPLHSQDRELEPRYVETKKIVITLYDPNFNTYNNMPDLFEPSGYTWERMLQKVAATHSHLLAHGDLQLRNFGEVNRRFTIIDPPFVVDLRNPRYVLSELSRSTSAPAGNGLQLVLKFRQIPLYQKFFTPEPSDPYAAAVSATITQDMVRIITSSAVLNYAAFRPNLDTILELKRELKQYLDQYYFPHLQNSSVSFQKDKMREFLFETIEQYITRSDKPYPRL